MLEDQQMPITEPTIVGQDNQSAIQIMRSPFTSISARSKHVHARFLWVHQSLQSGDISIVKIPTDELIADALTKSLGSEKFAIFRRRMVSE